MLWFCESMCTRWLDGKTTEEVDGTAAARANEDLEAATVFSAEIRARARGEETSLRGEGESEGTPTSEDTLPLLHSITATGGIRRRLGPGWVDAVSWLPTADTKTRRLR